MKNVYDGIATDFLSAQQAASNFFRSNFNHSGRTGIERRFSTCCECGETEAIEFYSKDDPGMADTFTAVICEVCHNSAPIKDKI